MTLVSLPTVLMTSVLKTCWYHNKASLCDRTASIVRDNVDLASAISSPSLLVIYS